MGVDFSSVRAALGTGESFIALVPRFSMLTSFLVVAGGLKAAQWFTCTGEAGAETTRLEGFAPIREFPFGGSLLRTVLVDCSTGFTRMLGRCGGNEMGVPVSKGLRAEGSSCATLGGLNLSP